MSHYPEPLPASYVNSHVTEVWNWSEFARIRFAVELYLTLHNVQQLRYYVCLQQLFQQSDMRETVGSLNYARGFPVLQVKELKSE